jgi:Domain of unknown function (DUF4192)
MTTIVKAASAAQFLSLIPRMLGYTPTQSVVLVPFDGSRSIGAMRFDLPAAAEFEELDRVAATLIGMVCRLPDADGIAVVLFTDDAFAERGMPHRDLMEALQRRAEDCGIGVNDALCVGADGWGSQFDPLCPQFGRPLNELDAAPTGAAHLGVADGDQASGSELPEIDLAERDRTAEALRALQRAVDLLCGSTGEEDRTPGRELEEVADDSRRVDPQALAAVCRLDDLPTLFEDAMSWDAETLAPYDSAALIWCLSRPALRDIALVQWCAGMDAGDEALDAQLRWESGEEYPTHIAMRMWGEGERPDPDRLLAALALCRRAAATAPRAMRAGALATCGWLAWALGRSTHAERYALTACEVEPEHGLAEIVRSFVHAGHLPDWAFRPR